MMKCVKFNSLLIKNVFENSENIIIVKLRNLVKKRPRDKKER